MYTAFFVRIDKDLKVSSESESKDTKKAPFGSSGFKIGACKTPQSDFEITGFAAFGFWEIWKLVAETVRLQ
jgi:hypothetical protein